MDDDNELEKCILCGLLTCALLPAGFAQTKAKLAWRNARTTSVSRRKWQGQERGSGEGKGKQTYSFDIEMPNGLHEVNIDAVTGKVIEDSIENAEDEAKEAAEDKAGKGKEEKAKQSPTPIRSKLASQVCLVTAKPVCCGWASGDCFAFSSLPLQPCLLRLLSPRPRRFRWSVLNDSVSVTQSMLTRATRSAFQCRRNRYLLTFFRSSTSSLLTCHFPTANAVVARVRPC